MAFGSRHLHDEGPAGGSAEQRRFGDGRDARYA
jgi:hypothetical protein